jgi:hypothetical protein
MGRTIWFETKSVNKNMNLNPAGENFTFNGSKQSSRV